jgi:hypothetical protein
MLTFRVASLAFGSHAVVLACASIAIAQQTAPATEATRPPETPWPIQLGLRTAALERSWPILDQVVLVPDARTYLDEISKWSASAHWPVLFEDDVYAPLFVRGFTPSRVIRRASVGAMPTDATERQQLMTHCAAEALADGSKDIINACLTRSFAPSMVVIADAADPAWTAAVALAAGRGAPMYFTSAPYGIPNDTINAKTFTALANEVEVAADRTGLPWKGLGDAIDAFVICRNVGWKCDPSLPAELQVNIPSGPFPTAAGQPIATLNALGRHSDGMWWAIGSTIFGSETRCAYVAMSSLFAPRKSAWLVNTYENAPTWNVYDAVLAAPPLEKQGMVTQVWQREQATLDAWRRLLMGGFGGEVLFVNSHGVCTQFGLASGGTATAHDVPVFDRPAMVHFIHSFSLEFPQNSGCVGSVFLDHGAYAYFGSVYEPLLSAFVPPELIAQRAEVLVPFAIAARQFEGPLARPWRVMSYGDPLTLMASPKKIGLTRIAPTADGIETLRDASANALKRFRDEKNAEALVDALRALELLGDDEKVKQVWTIAQTTEAANTAAPFALGAVFRARDLNAYAAAFAMCATHTPLASDMLWQLSVPRLPSLSDARICALLGRNPRGPDVTLDLTMLHATALRVLGADGWRSIVDGARRRARESGAADAVIDAINGLR